MTPGRDEPLGEQIISRRALENAVPTVSRLRYDQTLCAEYPELRVFTEQLRTKKAVQTLRTLAKIRGWGDAQNAMDYWAQKIPTQILESARAKPRSELKQRSESGSTFRESCQHSPSGPTLNNAVHRAGSRFLPLDDRSDEVTEALSS